MSAPEQGGEPEPGDPAKLPHLPRPHLLHSTGPQVHIPSRIQPSRKNRVRPDRIRPKHLDMAGYRSVWYPPFGKKLWIRIRPIVFSISLIAISFYFIPEDKQYRVDSFQFEILFMVVNILSDHKPAI